MRFFRRRRRSSKTHDVGPFFFQVIRAPYFWGWRLWVKGWTQEVDEPFRTSTPILVRLPFYRALALGRWHHENLLEDEALRRALEYRDVTEDDFTEEKGWTPPAGESGEESLDSRDFGPDSVGTAVAIHPR